MKRFQFVMLFLFAGILVLSLPAIAHADSGPWPTETFTPLPPPPTFTPLPPIPTFTPLPANAAQQAPAVTELSDVRKSTQDAEMALAAAKAPAKTNYLVVCLPFAVAFLVVAAIAAVMLISRRR